LQRNKLRGTPHYSIAFATGIPIAVLLLANGSLTLLGDMYAFGLLGAFTLTCLGLDLVRYRERKAIRAKTYTASPSRAIRVNGYTAVPPESANAFDATNTVADKHEILNGHADSPGNGATSNSAAITTKAALSLWSTIDFWLGILTTALVAIAWSTNLVSKPLATAFGGSVATIGMVIAFSNYMYHKRKGFVPVHLTGVEGRLPGSVLAVLTSENGHNDAVIRAAVNNADGHPIVFLYVNQEPQQAPRVPSMFEVVDPYLDDERAKQYFSKAESLAQKAKVPRRYVYRRDAPGIVARVWQAVHPHDTVIAAANAPQCEDLNPDRIRYELTSSGKVAHMLKQW
jgi:hypothetical protein